jgi:hypothetical protein
MSPQPSAGRLRDLARRVGISGAAKSASRALGYDIVRRHYYSPIPDLGELPSEAWTRESELRGLHFDPQAQMEFVERELRDDLARFSPPAGFQVANGFYEGVDAETLYAMVRRFEPRRVVELGSGTSTLLIAAARRASADADPEGHLVFDPYPRADLRPAIEPDVRLRRVAATEVPVAEFERLGDGDLLFVDTTHTVKLGGEVNRIILELLPALAPGVLVHFHDIFLPWEYPRELVEERNFYWAEQYLLQALLAFNPSFEILFSNHALHRCHPERLAALIPSAATAARPSAFWLRRAE